MLEPLAGPAGDYWPGEAEVLLNTIMEENRVGGKRGGGPAGTPMPFTLDCKLWAPSLQAG